MIDKNASIDNDITLRIKAAWTSWRKVTGVIYDKRTPTKFKTKIYTTIVRPALLYGTECWAMKESDKRRLNTTEMRMLRAILGVTRLDRIRNEEIRRRLNVMPIEALLRQGRLRWYGHVQRRDDGNAIRRAVSMALPGKRKRGRPRKTWKQQITEDMMIQGVTTPMTANRAEWRRRIRPTS